jgi:tetratricopeptide (TPR) repeat protein
MSTISVDTNAVDRAGVGLCEFRITGELGHIFREQPTSDYGVDAHVEIKREGRPTGRLIGLQLKSGRSRFGEESGEGWKFRPKKRHIPYWLGHSLPVYVLLVDTEDRAIYWQELSQATLQRGPRGGIYVMVPRTQTFETAGEAWERAASRFAESAGQAYVDNLTHLPPATSRAVQALATMDPDGAALLAAHLGLGRGSPELVVRTLLDSTPAWLLGGEPGQGLATLADYAHAHEENFLAVEALLKATELNPDRQYRYTRNAGLVLLQDDRSRARQLLDQAALMDGADGDPRLAIGYAVLGQPVDSANPIALTPAIEARLSAIDNDDMVVAFMARRAEHAGDVETAVALAEQALALDPYAAGYMELLAEILMRRAHSAQAQQGDRDRGIRLASAAVDQLHQWAGPTGPPLHTLLRSLIISGRFGEALNRSLAAPDGRALPDEALRPEVQTIAAIAAAALERADLADRVLKSMSPGLDREVLSLRLNPPGGGQPQPWLDLLGRLDDSRPEALLQVVLRLSDLGVDQSAQLNSMVERGIVPASTRAAVAAVAAAVADLDAGLPALRISAEADELAARKLVMLLADAGRLEDAEVASDLAHSRYRNVEFAVQRARMLRRLGRGAEATIVATDALSDSSLDPLNRRIANGLLARLALDDATAASGTLVVELLRRAERHLVECVDSSEELTPDENDVWLLAHVQLRLGEDADSYATLTRFDLPIETAEEARLWLSVLARQTTLPVHYYTRMLDLADQFADDAQLSGSMLGMVIGRTRDEEDEPATVVDARTTLPGEQRAAAFASLQTHIERHGEASPFRVLQAPSTEELIALMTEFMRRDPEPLLVVTELVRQARVPLGLLAAASSRPYASTLALRPLGYYLATSSVEEHAAEDEGAAATAPGGDVVIDASALLVATLLNEYDNTRPRFRSLIMPTVSRDDISRARADLDGRSASSGFVTYDPTSDSIVASEVDINDHLASLERLSLIESAAESVRLIPAVDLTPMAEVAITGSEAWLAPIALASARGVPLWSDDVAQRRLARHYGVSSFGTGALQQVRAYERLSDDSLTPEQYDRAFAERCEEVLNYLEHRVVDAPVDVESVVQQATAEDWDESVALITVGRPGWWHMASNPWLDVQSILNTAATAGANVDHWRYHAMWGAVLLTTDEPSRAATLLASVALIPTSNQADAAVAQHLRVAQEIATQQHAHRPIDFLADAATTLANAGVLNDAAATVERARSLLDNPSEGGFS